jgi:hypothetical protein
MYKKRRILLGLFLVLALTASLTGVVGADDTTVPPTETPTGGEVLTEEPPPVEPPAPTAEPTQQPTLEPTIEPTLQPTDVPSDTPTTEPPGWPTATVTEPPTPSLPPFIVSDKADYMPGEAVILTSGNWQPGESVHIVVNDDVGQSWGISTDVQADVSGAFNAFFYLPNWFVAQYAVTATGAVSGTATTTFTDKDPNTNIIVTASPSGALGGTFNITRQASNGNTQTSGGTTSQTYGGIQPASSFSITNIQSPVNGCTYTGANPVTGTAGAANTTLMVTLTYSCDTTPPDTSITANPTNPSNSSSASFSFTGTDDVTPAGSLTFECKLDGGVFAACTSPKGYSGLSDGSHTFEVRAKDAALNLDPSPASYTWTVDTTAPVIAPYFDVTEEATSASGAVVSYTSPATSDAVDGAGVASCSPASGSTFALGDTPVYCDAADAAGNDADQTSFVVHVVDTTAPVIAPYFDVTEEATSASGAVVSYTSPTTSDAVDGAGVASCSPASGSTFALGNTTVTCNATDAHGNAATPTTFVVKVRYAAAGGMCYGAPGHVILQPINSDSSSVFKKGSTVPAKFRVCDAFGNSIGTPGVVASFKLIQKISGTVSAVDEAVISTTPDTAFRWSSSDQQWIFNINSKNLSAGQTYVYLITLNDTSTIPFRFGLK